MQTFSKSPPNTFKMQKYQSALWSSFPYFSLLIKKARGMEFLERKKDSKKDQFPARNSTLFFILSFTFAVLTNANSSYISLVNDQQHL